MSGKSKEQKVSIVEKMGLFMVCAGNIPLMGLLSGFFMIYYTTVVGLEPAALATLFLKYPRWWMESATRLWDICWTNFQSQKWENFAL